MRKYPLLTLLVKSLLLTAALPVAAQSSLDHYTESDYLAALTDLSVRFDTADASGSTAGLSRPEITGTEEWQVVENYSFGKDRGNLPMIADVDALHPYFRDRVIRLISECRKKGIELRIVESFRTRAKQAEYFNMGRQYTQTTGGRSKHQYGMAVDVVPIVNGEAKWNNKALWRQIGTVGENLGLRWGGRWRSLYDPAHFEWSGGLSTKQLAGGILPALPNPDQYLCIEEDMAALRLQWEMWESLQGGYARE